MGDCIHQDVSPGARQVRGQHAHAQLTECRQEEAVTAAAGRAWAFEEATDQQWQAVVQRCGDFDYRGSLDRRSDGLRSSTCRRLVTYTHTHTVPATSTPLDTGTGQHYQTQIIYAVGYLKERPNQPIRLEDLAAFARVDELQHNAEMLAAFKAHERIVYDEKTDLYSYKPDFAIRNNNELLALLRRYSPRGGMLVKKLQESWPNAKSAIEELERDGKVMVIRTGGSSDREGQMKMVFWDEMGRMKKVDEEFNTMWHKLKLPDQITIAKELEEGGMKTTSTLASELPSSTANIKKPKKKGGNRKIKIQNTHLKELGIDLSKDFLKPGTPSSSSGKK